MYYYGQINRNFECHDCGNIFRREKDTYFRKCPKCKGVATVQMQIPKSQMPRKVPRG